MQRFDLSSLRFTARVPEIEGSAYLPVEETGLLTECRVSAGDGSAADPFRLELTFTNPNDRAWQGILHIETEAAAIDPGFFLPGWIYGHNTGELPDSGRKPFPRLRAGKHEKPFSSFWMTRADRLALPIALMEEGGRVRGLSAPAWWIRREGQTLPALPGADPKEFFRFGGFTCRTPDRKQGVSAAVGCTLGWENAPWLFIQTATVRDRAPLSEESCFPLAPGERVSCTVYLYDYPVTGRTGVLDALENTYFRVHEAPRSVPGMTVREAVSAIAGAVSDEAWLEEEGMYAGFVFDRPGGNQENKLGSLSWTNGFTVAMPQLLAGIRLGDEPMRARALTCIRTLTENSLNPASGLLYDAVENGRWSVRGWWFDGMHMPGHSAYLQGQALYCLLKAFLAERDLRGVTHPEWLSLAEKVQSVLDRGINAENEYPFVYSADTGAGLEYDALGGCWCLASALMLKKVTGDLTGLDRALACEQHYYDKYVARLECYGGPLDTDKAVDNEGILAYIRCARLLHELTGAPAVLRHLRDAIGYECSFKLGWNTPVQVPPLSEIGWSSCGGSITSVANPHIHPMSSTILDEMLYCAEKTDDTYIRSRARDTLLWGLQTFNTRDQEYGYGKRGWMSERFCFCQGLLTERYPDGRPASTWFALMPWAACSVIEGYLGDAWED